MLIFSAYWVLSDLLVFAANDLFAADLVAISSICRSWIANGTDRAGDIRTERLLASLRRIAPLGVHSVSTFHTACQPRSREGSSIHFGLDQGHDRGLGVLVAGRT